MKDGLSEFVGRARVWRVSLLVGLVFAALPVGSALAGTPSVFAGYAAGFLTNPSSLPSPWQGAAGVDFVGCNYFKPTLCPWGGKAYDAGALMLPNDTNRAMMVTDPSVTIGACTLEPWPGLNVIVNPGEKLILTETGGTMPCGGDGDDNFDTSDFCSYGALIPEFQVTVNRMGLTYRDTSRILNSGGKNRGACGGNEVRAWAPMSPEAAHPLSTTQTPPRGASPVLSAFRASPTRLSLAGRLVGGRCVNPTRKNQTHTTCSRPIALKLSYVLNTAATVMFRLTRQDPGRKVLGRCLKITSKNRTHAPCARPTRLPGALIHAGTAGSNTFIFQGATGVGPGNYWLTATPIANGSAGKSRSVTIKLVG